MLCMQSSYQRFVPIKNGYIFFINWLTTSFHFPVHAYVNQKFTEDKDESISLKLNMHSIHGVSFTPDSSHFTAARNLQASNDLF